jgi:tRNA (Thr-GGU) A37 N-methylase
VGITTVRLLDRQGSRLEVEGLDAIDGTPILDLKPYYPPYDRPRGRLRVPEYIHRPEY